MKSELVSLELSLSVVRQGARSRGGWLEGKGGGVRWRCDLIGRGLREVRLEELERYRGGIVMGGVGIALVTRHSSFRLR